MNHEAAGPSIDRRCDIAVRQLKLRVLNRGAVSSDDSPRRLLAGCVAVGLFLRDVVLLHELDVARGLGLRIFQVGFIARQVRLRLSQRRVVRTRVDREQHLAFADIVAFVEPDARQLAADEGANGDSRHRQHISDRADLYRSARRMRVIER